MTRIRRRLSSDLRGTGPRPFPIVVFAGSVATSEQLVSLGAAGVAGYLNEHADAPQILPALAPHLFPDSFNRRSSQRAAVSVPVSFRAGQTIAAAQTRDIGRGGIGIQTMDPLPVGTPLQFTLRLPGTGVEISASGRVIWGDRRLGMGLQFEKLSAEAQGQLDEYVRLVSPESRVQGPGPSGRSVRVRGPSRPGVRTQDDSGRPRLWTDAGLGTDLDSGLDSGLTVFGSQQSETVRRHEQ